MFVQLMIRAGSAIVLLSWSVGLRFSQKCGRYKYENKCCGQPSVAPDSRGLAGGHCWEGQQ